MAEYTIKTKGNTLTAADLSEAQELLRAISKIDWEAAAPSKVEVGSGKTGVNLQFTLDLTGSAEDEAPNGQASEVDSPANREGNE